MAVSFWQNEGHDVDTQLQHTEGGASTGSGQFTDLLPSALTKYQGPPNVSNILFSVLLLFFFALCVQVEGTLTIHCLASNPAVPPEHTPTHSLPSFLCVYDDNSHKYDLS